MEAVSRGAQEGQRRQMYAAGVIQRVAYHAKQMPSFEEVFRDRKTQTPDEIMAAMRAWSAVAEKGKPDAA